MKRLLILLVVAPSQAVWRRMIGRNQLTLARDQADRSQCLRCGFPPDTPAFGDCNVMPEKH